WDDPAPPAETARAGRPGRTGGECPWAAAPSAVPRWRSRGRGAARRERPPAPRSSGAARLAWNPLAEGREALQRWSKTIFTTRSSSRAAAGAEDGVVLRGVAAVRSARRAAVLVLP